MVTPFLVAIVGVFLTSSPIESEAHALCVGQEATALALVGLHEGPNCTLVSLRGIQQQAAILAAAQAVDNALSKDGMNFKVRVFDTCSDSREAVSATLRALAALPHACLQPPLLLGFVGPEDAASLEAVEKVTKVFNLNHAIPFRLDSTATNSKHGPLYVTSANLAEQLQAVVQLTSKLQWGKVTLLHTADPESTQMASSLAKRLCVVGQALTLPEYEADSDSYSSKLNSLEIDQDTPVIILTRSSLAVSQFLRMTGHAPPAYLVAASTVGLLPELTNMAIPAPVLLVQHTSGKQPFNSEHWERYRRQHHLPANADIQNVLADIQDPSVVPLAHAVALYGSALGVVRQARCQGRSGACSTLSAISSDQWRNLLSVAMTPVDSSNLSSKRARFRMETPTKAEIFLKLSPGERIIKVGQVDGGKLDVDSEDLALVPSVNSTDELSCWDGHSAAATKSIVRTSVAPGAVDFKEDVETESTSMSDEDYQFYEMIAYLSGISAGIFFVFLIGLFIVIRSFVPKKRKSSPPSSVSSVRTRD